MRPNRPLSDDPPCTGDPPGQCDAARICDRIEGALDARRALFLVSRREAASWRAAVTRTVRSPGSRFERCRHSVALSGLQPRNIASGLTFGRASLDAWHARNVLNSEKHHETQICR